ncbi:DUF397 domain-containing protein [Actinopolymorpha sp. B9G3]|uniref:DUF397 domain-containing protein n=1 Tax=Actinopolymorpha sp. B9G3 TaxID=3158970 RepID=UPI0032D8B540
MSNAHTPPALDEFGAWNTPSGPWRGGACTDGPCVAVAYGPDGWVAVTDTKNPDGAVLTFTADEWSDFRKAIVGNTI